MNEVTVRVVGPATARVVEVSIPGAQGPSLTRAQLTATEAIPAGRFVTISASGGEAKLSLADSTDDTSPAHGYCPAAIADDATGKVIFGHGQLLPGLSALTPGAAYYLGTAGQPTDTVPVADGALIQFLGIALSATELIFTPDRGVTL